MARTLVTGATGSLGSALTRHLLESGIEVVVLRQPGTGLGGLREHRGEFAEVPGDVTDPAGLRRALVGVEHVYHLAGIATTLDRLHPAMMRVNVEGAANLANAAADAGVRRLVHTSTIAAIGYPPDGQTADEDFDFTRSVVCNSYMITKRAGEEAVLRIAAARELDVVVVNPAAVIAPHSHLRYGWAGLVRQVARGRLKAYPPGGVSVCAVDEFVAGQVAAMRYGVPGRRYLLATENLSYRDLIARVCRVVGVPAPARRIPAAAVRAAGRLGSLAGRLYRDPMRAPFLTCENAELSARTFFYSSQRSRAELALAPGHLDASIASVHRWLQEEGRSRDPALR